MMTGTQDGTSSTDTDRPYEFGGHPTVALPGPFRPMDLARLLIMRARLLDEAHTLRTRGPSTPDTETTIPPVPTD